MSKHAILASLLLCVITVSSIPSSPLLTKLETVFRQKEFVNVFITLKQSTSKALATISYLKFANRTERLNSVYTALQNNAENSQKPIINFISNQTHSSFHVQSFWITNQIFVKNANKKIIYDVISEFSGLISSVDEEVIAYINEPISIKPNVTLIGEEPQWGIVKIQAREAWEEVERSVGVKAGEGVIISTIDTGVRGTHFALRDNFVGEYGWFDPSSKTDSPNDHNGHGTHTTGTIVGRKGIGVAPNAKWAACKGCPTVFCFQSALLACGQFFLCPSLTDGTKPDCSKAPHLVSNSWGSGRGDAWYNGVIDAWHAAGIIPIFSIGNSGPICDSVTSPGDQQNVIAVGSTTNRDEISLFSSVGPTMDKRLKPEIVAPGSDVISAYHTADDAYASISGTSMACPHAAGTVAILQTRNNEISFSSVKELLLGNADQNMRFSGRVCNGIRDNEFPNNVFGHGRINALKSVLAQKNLD